MNDFTKEELRTIISLIGSYEMVLRHNDMGFKQEEINIANKIQFMIDNYRKEVCPIVVSVEGHGGWGNGINEELING